jgi:Ca2+-binding EF-hand superfamily protein
MKRIITTIAALAVSAAFVTAADAAKKPAEGAAKPKADPEAMFKKKDKDGDGALSKDEYTAGSKDAAKAEASFKAKDKDADGKVTKEEFMAKGGKKKK